MSTKKKNRGKIIPKETVKRLLKHGAGSNMRVSEKAVELTRDTLKEYLKQLCHWLKGEAERDRTVTLLSRHTKSILTESRKCGWNIKYNQLADESVLKISSKDGVKKGVTISSMKRALKKGTGLSRISDKAARDVAIAVSVLISRIGKNAAGYTHARSTKKKSTNQILERDVAFAVNQMDGN